MDTTTIRPKQRNQHARATPSRETLAATAQSIPKAEAWEGTLQRVAHPRPEPVLRSTLDFGTALELDQVPAALLRTCMDTVNECLDRCVGQGGRNAAPENLRAHMDAWDLLSVTAKLASRNSACAGRVRQACIDAVKRCELACRSFGGQGATGCADACRETHGQLAAYAASGFAVR